MPTKDQLKLIHALKRALRLDDGEYRGLLGSYGVESSKDLGSPDAAKLIDWMQQQAVAAGVWKNHGGKPKEKPYEHLKGRLGMASPAQLRMIEALWKVVSVCVDPDSRKKALRNFLSRFGVSAPEFLPVNKVPAVINALQAMERQKLAKTGAKAA